MPLTRSRQFGLVAAGGVAIAGVVGFAATAQAGHENPVLFAELSGANEVGADGALGVGDAEGAGEAYVFGIDDDPTTLCYVITAEGIDQTFVAGETGMAHIHRGGPEENGPVVAALAFPLGGDSGDCLTEGEPDKFPLAGEAGEPASIVADILANPASYYVNVHTGEFPDGAIRGQLVNVQDMMVPSDSVAPAGSVAPTGSMPMGTEPMGSEPMGSMPMGTEPMGSEPMGSMPMGTEPMGTEPMDTMAPPDSMAPASSGG